MNDLKLNTLIAPFATFVIGVAVGLFIFRLFFLNAERIESLAEQKAKEKLEILRRSLEKQVAFQRDSLLKQEKDRLILDYKRIITSDDVKISKRVDEIIDSLYSIKGK